MRKWIVVSFILGMAPLGVRADQKSLETDDGRHEITDASIAERRKQLVELLQKRTDEINKDFSEVQIFEAKRKDERLDFERRMIDERRDFLDSLKKTDKDARWKALKDFNAKEADERRAFGDELRKKREEFRAAREEARNEFVDDLHKRREEKKAAPAPAAKNP